MKTTTSPAQAAANRLNAQHSSGPRTPEGKIRSSQNARKFRGIDFSALRLEGLHDLDHYRTGFIDSYKPQNAVELSAIEILAQARHDLDRAYRLKAGLLSTAIAEMCDREGFLPVVVPNEVGDNAPPARSRNNAAAAVKGIHKLSRESDVFLIVLRWATQADREFRRAEERFYDLRKLRDSLAADPESPYSENLQIEANLPAQPQESTELTAPEDPTQTQEIPLSSIFPADPATAGFQIGDAEVSGTIYDDLGPAENAAVALMSENQELRCVVTGSDGHYCFPNLPAGNFLLDLIHPGDVQTMTNLGFMQTYEKHAFTLQLTPGQHVEHFLARRSSGFTSGMIIKPEKTA